MDGTMGERVKSSFIPILGTANVHQSLALGLRIVLVEIFVSFYLIFLVFLP